MTQIKVPMTVRLNADLLSQIRRSAAADNRSLANFIETALRERLDTASKRVSRRATPAPWVTKADNSRGQKP